MDKLKKEFSRIWFELRRRKTIRTAVTYLIVLAAVVGPVSDILSGLGAPDLVLRIVISVLLAAYPFVLVISWMFDITSHGFERTPDIVVSSNTDNESKNEIKTVSEANPVLRTSIASIELESAHRHQVTLLRCTFTMQKGTLIVDDPGTMLGLLPQLQHLVDSIGERYLANNHDHDGITFELLFGYPLHGPDAPMQYGLATVDRGKLVRSVSLDS